MRIDVHSACSALFTHWGKPPLFPDATVFFQNCPLPIYIVSNIDRADILSALDFYNLAPAGVFTSEDARSYKPRPELFTYAMRAAELRADEVVHIGDSLNSDVDGAASAGIRSITDLLQALHTLFPNP